jgi:hypothetical protein
MTQKVPPDLALVFALGGVLIICAVCFTAERVVDRAGSVQATANT